MNRDIDPRAEYYLNLWRDWMRKHDAGNGYPGKSAGFVTGGINCFNDWEEQIDGEAIRATDASIDSLSPHDRAVIYTVWLQAVFRFRTALEEALPIALAAFMLEMRRRGME